MQLGVFLVTGLLLVLVCWLVRFFSYQGGRQFDFNESVKLVMASLAGASAVTFSILPAGWFAISFALRRGPIEDNLLPGSSIDNLVVALVLGTAVTTLWGVRGFLQTLQPQGRPARRRVPPK
jgi:hypothetical protein